MRKNYKTAAVLLCGIIVFQILSFQAAGAEDLSKAIQSETDVTVNIRKRTQWVDETNGDCRITLQYESNSGNISTIPDMNVVLIHDKSGSMDCNYGYNLEVVRQGWGLPDRSIDYPILNSNGWSETITHIDETNTNDLESEGPEAYMQRIHSPNEYTSQKGADAGFYESTSSSRFYANEVKHSSPCQTENHYYLLINNDFATSYKQWQMVSGANLADITYTDLHHYIKLDSREDALAYIEEGRRVLRMTMGSYVDESGMTNYVHPDMLDYEAVYFLDVTKICAFEGKWIINTCAAEECRMNDRLAKSQYFFGDLVNSILTFNPDNQIAYIPFWGDVPVNGCWTNFKASEDNQGVTDITSAGSYLKEYRGDKNGDGVDDTVTRLDFTSDADCLYQQINHSFTYNGTNWSRAFQSAIEFLEGRSAENQNKKTMVLFLTDGLPHATYGNVNDFRNPALNGIEEIKVLHSMNGVNVLAVAVGVSGNDTTGLAARLTEVVSAGEPIYAKNTSDMDKLAAMVMKMVQEAYVEDIYGTDAFYRDTLGEDFVLDETKLGNDWKILSTADEELTRGVPGNVYEAVRTTGADTGIRYVYVKSTKTVYWYIGELENGSFSDEGHTFEFSVKYTDYGKHTLGEDKKLQSNVSQKMTYYTNKVPEKLREKTMEVPQIIFNRQRTKVEIVKNVSEAKDYDRVCRFVCSMTGYTEGIVRDVKGSVEITIPAGSSRGEGMIYDLDAAVNSSDSSVQESVIYYIYEVDENNRIINPEIQSVSLSFEPVISTKEQSSAVPYSVWTSDEEAQEYLKNVNNHLQLSASSETVTFSQKASLRVVKEISCSDEDIRWEHGNPIFVIRVLGREEHGKEYTFYHTFEFTREYVKANQYEGKVSMSYTFTDLPALSGYQVEELKCSRYHLSSVVVDAENPEAGQVTNDPYSDENVFPAGALVNLVQQPEGITVTFFNEKINYGWFSHLVNIKNIIEK